MTASLYERLGGAAAIDAAVDLFYDKVLADNRIAPFFVGVPMQRQRAHQKAFLTLALGGASGVPYQGRGMREAHATLNLTDAHFDAVLENLADALMELGVTETLVAEVGAAAEALRPVVLGR